jgi:hypothetical protein
MFEIDYYNFDRGDGGNEIIHDKAKLKRRVGRLEALGYHVWVWGVSGFQENGQAILFRLEGREVR